MRIDRDAADAAWPALLAMKRLVRASDGSAAPNVAFVRESGAWTVVADGPAFDTATLYASERPDFAPPSGERASSVVRVDPLSGATSIDRSGVLGADDEAVLAAVRLYAPLVFGSGRAVRSGGSFVIAHVAQSLDARIACVNGHSQWISNDANLRHAHRLRALHDAVVVGGRTVERDDPRLTVRLVDGDDPARVILSGSASVLRGEASYRALDGGVVVCREDAETGAAHGAEVLSVPSPATGLLTPRSVLDALRRQRLATVFVEGGGMTLSAFLEHGAIDVLHVHVAPIVLGSGVASFTLPEIACVQDARRFDVAHFDLDGEMLFECRPVCAE